MIYDRQDEGQRKYAKFQETTGNSTTKQLQCTDNKYIEYEMDRKIAPICQEIQSEEAPDQEYKGSIPNAKNKSIKLKENGKGCAQDKATTRKISCTEKGCIQ